MSGAACAVAREAVPLSPPRAGEDRHEPRVERREARPQARRTSRRLRQARTSSLTFSSSLRRARLSRVEHAVRLMPSTRAAVSPSRSQMTRSAITSRSPGDRLWSADSSSGDKPSPNTASLVATSCVPRTSPLAGDGATPSESGRAPPNVRSGTATSSAFPDAGRSGASVRGPARRSRLSDPRPRLGLPSGRGGRRRRRRGAPRRLERSSSPPRTRLLYGAGRAPCHSGLSADCTACPPNCLRSAAFTFAANDSSWREAKREKSASAIVGAGTRSSIAVSTVQRPSPESST